MKASEMDALDHRGRAEEDRGRKVGREGEKTVAPDLAERGNLDARQPCRGAGRENRKNNPGMRRIWCRSAVIDQLGQSHGQCLCSADIASRTYNRSVPSRLRFKCKEDCQQAEADRERFSPQAWGTGGPS